jgi:hypothetical protein
MEQVLDVYKRPYDPLHPVVCMDEKPYQLLSDIQAGLAMEPGRCAISDYEYKREGSSSIFVAFEPLTGKRSLLAKERRTKKDYAYWLRHIADELYPDAQKIILVQDNLNTHTFGSLYETFSPEEAFRLMARFEPIYTPKHASWLNMAELEFSVLERQCLAHRRLASIALLNQQLQAYQQRRNAQAITVDWHFTPEAARIKLKRLYPEYSEQKANTDSASLNALPLAA